MTSEDKTTEKSTRWFTERSLEQRKDYAQRFVRIAAEGNDIDGEASLTDAMATPGSSILDAGRGVGPITNALTLRGHEVIGVDADPLLIEAAREHHPAADRRVLDPVAPYQHPHTFALIVCT